MVIVGGRQKAVGGDWVCVACLCQKVSSEPNDERLSNDRQTNIEWRIS